MTVGVEDTTSFQINPPSWGGAGSQAQGGALVGQAPGSSRGDIVGQQLSQGTSHNNFLVDEQVRQPGVWRGLAAIEAVDHNGGAINLPIPRTPSEGQGYQHLPLGRPGGVDELGQPRAQDQIQAGPESATVRNEVLGQAVQQAGIGEGYQEVAAQPGPSGAGGSVGLAAMTPQPQEGHRRD